MNDFYFIDDNGLVSQVFVKVNYDQAKEFGRNQRNRKVQPTHVNDFYQWICENGVRSDGTCYGPYPIHINKQTNHILDGQHKLEAYLKAIENGKIPENTPICVAYENMTEDDEIVRIIELNMNSKNWSLDDYVECEEDYNDNYRRLTAFAKTHDLCYSYTKTGKKSLKYRYSAAILTGKGCAKALKSRTIEITKEDLERGEKVHDELVAIRKDLCRRRGVPYSSETNNDLEAMVIQWYEYRDYITIDEFIKYKYIPANLLNKDKRRQEDWKNLFNEIVSAKVMKKDE